MIGPGAKGVPNVQALLLNPNSQQGSGRKIIISEKLSVKKSLYGVHSSPPPLTEACTCHSAPHQQGGLGMHKIIEPKEQ